MKPATRRVTALAVFVVAAGVATLVWASKNGSVGITWGDLISGCMSALIITLIVNSLMKSAGRATHGQPVGSTTPSQPPSPKPEPPTTHDKVGVTAKSPAPTQDLSGDDLWSRAINSAGSGKPNEAKAFFVSAISKNPWKYCGVGHDSWKPSRTEHQAIWLDAMAQAGFGELARAIRNPPEPAELTISALMGADHQLEQLLDESCRRLGVMQSLAVAAEPKQGRSEIESPSRQADAPAARPQPSEWIQACVWDKDLWGSSLDREHRDFLTGLHEGEVQIVVDRIVAVLQTTDLYWQFCVCTKLLEPLGAKAVAALPVLIQPRFLRHEQSAWRQFAVRAIGKIGLPAQSALPHLIEAQRDADEQVRREAAEAIKEVS